MAFEFEVIESISIKLKKENDELKAQIQEQETPQEESTKKPRRSKSKETSR